MRRVRSGGSRLLLFTEQRVGQIGRLSPDGSVGEFPAGGTSGGSAWPDQITTGPDGNLWFTEFRAPA